MTTSRSTSRIDSRKSSALTFNRGPTSRGHRVAPLLLAPVLGPVLATLLALFAFASNLSAAVATEASGAPSAVRLPGETIQSAMDRVLSEPGTWVRASRSSAASERKIAKLLDVSQAPEWNSTTPLEEAFEAFRDVRFLKTRAQPNFPRRISWLYPDDGCFARAEYLARLLEKAGHAKPAKIFAFGDLEVDTDNSPSGSVSWWYHVVVGYRVGEQLIVLDPAIDASGPLPFEKWIERMGGTMAKTEASLCDEATYQPFNACNGGDREREDVLRSDQLRYLEWEWDRVVELGRKPELVLGDEPPWKRREQIPFRSRRSLGKGPRLTVQKEL